MTEVNLEIANSVATVNFGNERGNALLSSAIKDLQAAVTKASQDKSVKVLAIHSSGRAFCSGAALNELALLKTPTAAEKFFNQLGALLISLVSAPIPIVARVQGKAVGGGLGLIAAADYAIASSNVAVRLSELAIGLGPLVIGPFVERKIGLAHFSALTLDTEWREAEWCKAVGLISKIVEPDELDAATLALTFTLSSLSREALAAYKRSLVQSLPALKGEVKKRAKISAKLALSKEAQAAIVRFLEP